MLFREPLRIKNPRAKWIRPAARFCCAKRLNVPLGTTWQLDKGLLLYKTVAIQQLVLIRARVHPFPSRTRKLSSLLPTILGWRRPGKIGSANTKEVTHASDFFFYCFGGRDIVQAILFGWIRYIGSYFVTIRWIEFSGAVGSTSQTDRISKSRISEFIQQDILWKFSYFMLTNSTSIW